MLLLRATVGLLFWVAVEVIVFMPLYAIGLVAFPIAWRLASRVIRNDARIVIDDKRRLAFKSRVLDAWLGNYEDGLLPEWWKNEHNGTAYGWFRRNPVTNLRFIYPFGVLPNPSKVGWAGTKEDNDNKPGWFMAWQGLHTGFQWCSKTWKIWMGWKVLPLDRYGIPSNYRRFGIGLAAQIERLR